MLRMSFEFEDSPSEFLHLMEKGIQESSAPVYDAFLEVIKWGNLNFVAMLMRAFTHISNELIDNMSRNVSIVQLRVVKMKFLDFYIWEQTMKSSYLQLIVMMS